MRKTILIFCVVYMISLVVSGQEVYTLDSISKSISQEKGVNAELPELPTRKTIPLFRSMFGLSINTGYLYDEWTDVYQLPGIEKLSIPVVKSDFAIGFEINTPLINYEYSINKNNFRDMYGDVYRYESQHIDLLGLTRFILSNDRFDESMEGLALNLSLMLAPNFDKQKISSLLYNETDIRFGALWNMFAFGKRTREIKGITYLHDRTFYNNSTISFNLKNYRVFDILGALNLFERTLHMTHKVAVSQGRRLEDYLDMGVFRYIPMPFYYYYLEKGDYTVWDEHGNIVFSDEFKNHRGSFGLHYQTFIYPTKSNRFVIYPLAQWVYPKRFKAGVSLGVVF